MKLININPKFESSLASLKLTFKRKRNIKDKTAGYLLKVNL